MSAPEKNYEAYEIARDTRVSVEHWFNAVRNVAHIGEIEFKHKISRKYCVPPDIRFISSRTDGWDYKKEHTSPIPEPAREIILEKILNNWEEEIESAISELKKREMEALLRCQSYIDYLQEQVNKAKEREINE